MSTLEQVVLSGNDIEVVVVPDVGARLHGLRVHGADLLRTPTHLSEHLSDPFFWGGYVLAPWCNRVDAAPTEVLGQVVDLASNFEDGSAIHGQVYASAWAQTGDSSFAIDHEGAGWPWPYRVEIEYLIEASRLTIAQRLRNDSSTQMPGGIGLHPWLLGEPRIAIHAASAYESNADSAPFPGPVAGKLDMRVAGSLEVGVDATWVDLDDPALELNWPELGLRATLRSRNATLHIVAANPGDRGAIAVEPQTHAPQGLRRLMRRQPGALAIIEPGEILELTTELAFEAMSS
ncbi:MAG: hypothetical protein ABIP53_03950 [Candidatus Limnocylindrales bacterium]